MTIEEDDYKLEYDADHDLFDLYLIKVINAKDPSKRREELTLMAYSVHLDYALRRIVNYRINKNSLRLSFKEYFLKYKEESAKFTKIIEDFLEVVKGQ